MKRNVLFLYCFVLMQSTTQASELYRWVDSSGIVHYSDIPPPKADQIETRRFSSTTGSDEILPYETRLAQQNFPVTLYIAPGCGEPCNDARSLLNKRGIPYTEKSLKTREDVEAFKQLSGIEGFPVLSVGKSFLKGFLAEQWHSELDFAGYPKIPPYRAPDKPSASDAANKASPDNSPGK